MVIDQKFRVDNEAAMATSEVEIGNDSCLPLKQLSRKARSAFLRTKGGDKGDSCLPLMQLSRKTRSAFVRTKTLVSSILKQSLALQTRAPGPAARRQRRRAVSWATAVSQ